HTRKGLPERRISDEAIDALKGYRWPGNVRELKNLIERSVILARGDVITPRDLPQSLFETNDPLPEQEEEGDVPLANVERRHILTVLRRQNGNKVRAAKILGINVKTLYNKIKSY